MHLCIHVFMFGMYVCMYVCTGLAQTGRQVTIGDRSGDMAT